MRVINGLVPAARRALRATAAAGTSDASDASSPALERALFVVCSLT